LEYKTLSVEQILNKFQKELEQDVLIYKEQARVVAERDAILRDAQRDIQSLTTKLHRCYIQQDELEKTVSSITAFQDEMERTLADCESSVNELFRSQGNVAPVSSDFERENIFKTLEDVESRLQAVQEAFELASSQMNQGIVNSCNRDNNSTEVAQIIQVLYQHQLTLQEVELTSRRMDKEMDEVSKILRRAEQHHNHHSN
jgi:Nsp1-like C-terminal region